MTPTGWQCPLCGKIHAPWVTSCVCTGPPSRLIPRPSAPKDGYFEPGDKKELLEDDGWRNVAIEWVEPECEA